MRKKLLFSLLTLCFLGAIKAAAFATDYYVDSSCSYNGNGQSQTCAASPGATGPFKSLANAQSGLTGDQSDNSLLFKKGLTYSGQFTVGAYGTSGHPFTISSYGTGADPIISGGNSAVYLSAKDYITIDGISVGGATAAWNAGIFVISSSGVIVQNCTHTDAVNDESSGIVFMNVTNSTIDSNTVQNPTGYNGIVIQGGDSDTITVINNTIYNVRVTGLHTGGAVDNRITNLTVYGNETYNCKAGMYFNWTDNSNIYDNYIHDNKVVGVTGEPYGIGAMSCSNNNWYNNIIHDNNNKGLDIYGDCNPSWGPAEGNKVYNNWFDAHTNAGGYGLNLGSSNDYQCVGDNEAFYNIFTGNNLGIGTDAGSTVTGIVMYGNVFYNNAVGIRPTRTNVNIIIKNNIFSENSSYAIDDNISSSGLTRANNLYYKTGGGNLVRYDSTTYTNSNIISFETTAVYGDPSFVVGGPDSWDDFRLNSDSPAINAGQDLGPSYESALRPNDTTWPPPIVLQGNYGSGWEIGAFIYNSGGGAAPEPPTGLTVAATAP